jgi:hypothetical protein
MRIAAIVLLLVPDPTGQEPASAKVDFFRDVRPVLTTHCDRCHGPEQQKGGLRLDSREAALKGGDTGPAFVPGKPDESLLLKLAGSKDLAERMPQKAEALPAEELEILRRWIAEGADWPDVSAAASAHWAFRPLARPPVPPSAGWGRTPVDAFVARAHAERGLRPSPEADPRTLLRRLTLGLTGLPPTPEEARAFAEDRRPDAVERAVERLLASPRYGERWGRHWLDLARFAETSGYEANALRSSAWRYRDYVIRSLNEDKPFDRFLREQLAGDELRPLADEHLVATGFLSHGRLDNNQEDRAVQRNDHLVDITNLIGSVFFGVSFGCAQCHDHKWDPITQQDYYRLQGFFVRGQVNPLVLEDPAAWKDYEARIPPELEPAKALKKALLETGRKKVLKAEEAGTKKVPDDQAAKALGDDDRKLLAELDKKIQALEKAMPEKPHVWGFGSPATSPHELKTLPIKGFYPLNYEPARLKEAKPRVLRRGDAHLPGAELEPGWPAVFGPTPPGTWSRSALAEQLTRPDHPTTARVLVNFVWQQHFGRGLVETPGDFGLRGAKPSLPELLDWLASEFVGGGWSLKKLHRLIVLSATYRQASRPDGANAKLDPENRLLWRWSPRRLEAEAIRDSLLAASGELDPAMGGPSLWEEPQSKEEKDAPKAAPNPRRRTLYYLQKRHHFPEAQELFDGPGAGESCPKRYVSTVSLQPLWLMNGAFTTARAKALAARLKAVPDPIEAAFESAFARPPGDRERAAAAEFLKGYPGEPEKGLFHLCHALFSANEFVYVE